MKTIWFSLVLLLTGATLAAQPVVKFDQTTHDFGTISEDAGAVHDFTFTNTGSSPLIIRNVTTSCGCTTPEWTKQPVAPGAKGSIKVKYDTKGRPGAIDKTITVSTNAKPAQTVLRIIGEVTATDRAPAEAYRFPMGALRLSDRHVDFGQMLSSEKPTLTVTAWNPSNETVSIAFANLPPYLSATITPSSLKKGEKAALRITYDAAKKNDWGFVSDQLSLSLNGKTGAAFRLTVTADIREDFSRLSAAQLQNAPAATVENATLNAGSVKQGEQKTVTFKLRNTGKGKLLVRKVESASQQVKVASAPKEIAAGATADLSVTYTAGNSSGEQTRSLMLITNDPRNPALTLTVKAEVR
jgi:hypothetical protein